MWHLTCDKWQMKCFMRHTEGDEHFVKISGLLWFGCERVLKILNERITDWNNQLIKGYLPIMPVHARDKERTSREKAGTSRYKAGTCRDKAGTNKDKQSKSLSVPVCQCFSLSVPAFPCLSLSILLRPCLSLSLSFPVCPCLSLSASVFPCPSVSNYVCPCLSMSRNHFFLSRALWTGSVLCLVVLAFPDKSIQQESSLSCLWHQDHVSNCWPPSYYYIDQDSFLSLTACLQQGHWFVGWCWPPLTIPSNRIHLCLLNDAVQQYNTEFDPDLGVLVVWVQWTGWPKTLDRCPWKSGN